MKGGQFSFTYEWQSPDPDVEESVMLTISGVVSDRYPETGPTYDSGGEPAYGGEIEDLFAIGPGGVEWTLDVPTRAMEWSAKEKKTVPMAMPLHRAVEDFCYDAVDDGGME